MQKESAGTKPVKEEDTKYMVTIVGVRFRSGGKVYYFDPKDYNPRMGDRVIVETARGLECGRVVLGSHQIPEKQVVQPLREIIRMATEKDIAREESNRVKEKEAYRICQEKIRELHLDMKLIQAEYSFDNKKLLFYFTADGRVDFRELVRELAAVFKTRIELRQIGVRDETKLLGGIGICGRPLCCHTYLSNFAPVSIKMAKEQNLSLNPAKISGVCGRLMCCLKNEQETYEYLNKNLPGLGDIVQVQDGPQGIVQSVNVLKQTVRILIEEGDDKEMQEHPVEELTLVMKHRKGTAWRASAEKEETRPSQEEGRSGRGEETRRRNSQEEHPENRKEEKPGRDRNRGRSRGKDRDREQKGEPEQRERRRSRGKNRSRNRNRDKGTEEEKQAGKGDGE
jgi:cell fate regulator YaaT (PSP1 superfamily)